METTNVEEMISNEEKEFVTEVSPVFTKISGWLSSAEAAALFFLARSLGNLPNVVEIGSYVGKSSVVLGLAVKPLQGRVYCVDPFDVDYLDFKGSRLVTFLRNIREVGLLNICVPYSGTSAERVRGWKTPIDMLFIDGDHQYEAVKQDYLLWTPYLRDGGILAMHDVDLPGDPWPPTDEGPGLVARELIFPSDEWPDVERIDRLLVARKKAQ